MSTNPELSKSQIKFLKKVQKKHEYIFSSSDFNMVIYLCKNGLLYQYTKSSNLPYCQLTEYGEAYLYSLKIQNYRWRIVTTISVIALIVSIAAIVLSPFFTAFFTKLYGL